jgi:hypothetical protein
VIEKEAAANILSEEEAAEIAVSYDGQNLF